MAKSRKYSHRDFESKTERGKYTKVCNDMMESTAWNALDLRQRGLYLQLKAKYTQKVSNGNIISDNAENISIPKSEATSLYGNLKTFRKDMDKLIECGFIKMVQCGWNTRTVNIYGFSERWKEYGMSGYNVPENEKRTHKTKAI